MLQIEDFLGNLEYFLCLVNALYELNSILSFLIVTTQWLHDTNFMIENQYFERKSWQNLIRFQIYLDDRLRLTSLVYLLTDIVDLFEDSIHITKQFQLVEMRKNVFLPILNEKNSSKSFIKKIYEI